ncbi:hypothetical protein OPQ81_003840 [Rhizoctonia solani]|nr:hypothetical protein OPQ81_003840 [Rhizoctonia solani]
MSADPQELYKDLYPTAWKVLRISGGNVGTSASVIYSARLAFGVKQSTHKNITIPQTHVEIGTQLSTTEEGFIHWSLPVGRQMGSEKGPDKGVLKAINNMQEQKDICIGTLDTDKSVFSPMICWPCVNNGATAAVDFLPYLHVYAFSGLKGTSSNNSLYVENFLGGWNLSLLQNSPNDNRFHLFEDKNDGKRLQLVKD